MKIQMKLNTGLKLTGGWNQRICESAGDVITLVNDVLFSYKLNTHLLKTEAWICLCKCKRNGHVNVSVAPVYLQFGTMSLIVSLFWPHYASISQTYPDKNVCGRIFGCGEWSSWKTMTHLLLVQWALIYWFVLFCCQKRRNSRNWEVF